MFLTGPGFDPEVTEYCVEEEIVVIPGALTPTEVMFAHGAEADFVKVFPCSHVGGPRYIHALKASAAHVLLVAAGGVTQSTAAHFITAGATALGCGEDLIPRQAVRFREGAWIRELASRFSILCDRPAQRRADYDSPLLPKSNPRPVIRDRLA